MSNAPADSPEFVALSGFPQHAVRLVAVRQAGDAAYVLIDTRPDGPPYLYGIHLERENGRWVEGSSGNGPGWTRTTLAEDLGTLTLWGEAPVEADRARASYGDELSETAVENGAYLFVWWSTPCPEHLLPRLEAFQIAGTWSSSPLP